MGHASLKTMALVVRQHNIGASTVMTSTAEEKAFLRVAVAAIPRVIEIILGFRPDDRAGALETAERRFLAAALDYGCTEITAQSRVSAVMRRLRSRLERREASERNLQELLQNSQNGLNLRLPSRPNPHRLGNGLRCFAEHSAYPPNSDVGPLTGVARQRDQDGAKASLKASLREHYCA